MSNERGCKKVIVKDPGIIGINYSPESFMYTEGETLAEYTERMLSLLPKKLQQRVFLFYVSLSQNPNDLHNECIRYTNEIKYYLSDFASSTQLRKKFVATHVDIWNCIREESEPSELMASVRTYGQIYGVSQVIFDSVDTLASFENV